MQTPFDQRENNFDFIRMFLAVLVIFSHSYPLGTGSESLEPVNRLTRYQVTGGHMAVDLFFIISGFLITASYERSPTVGSYLKKRFFRIYPAFIVAMVVCAVIFVPLSGGNLGGPHASIHLIDFVLETAQLQQFHVQGVFPHNPVAGVMDGSVWSIPFEFWCYVGVMLLGLSGLLRSNAFLIALFFITLGVGVLFSVYGWIIGGKILGVIFGYPVFWARLLPMYLAGIVAYRLRAHLRMTRSWILGACGLLIAAGLLPHGWPLLFPVVGAYLILVIAYSPFISLHGWNRFGDFSYGTYLYAYPIQQLVVRWAGHPMAPWRLFCIAAPLTVCCAALSWHSVEKWFLLKSHRPVTKKNFDATQISLNADRMGS